MQQKQQWVAKHLRRMSRCRYIDALQKLAANVDFEMGRRDFKYF